MHLRTKPESAGSPVAVARWHRHDRALHPGGALGKEAPEHRAPREREQRGKHQETGALPRARGFGVSVLRRETQGYPGFRVAGAPRRAGLVSKFKRKRARGVQCHAVCLHTWAHAGQKLSTNGQTGLLKPQCVFTAPLIGGRGSFSLKRLRDVLVLRVGFCRERMTFKFVSCMLVDEPVLQYLGKASPVLEEEARRFCLECSGAAGAAATGPSADAVRSLPARMAGTPASGSCFSVKV